MRIRMKALDTLFFRDGKPFSKGEETWSDGIFPPYPSVIYGALRSAYFSENIEIFRSLLESKELNTAKDISTNARIREISLLVDDKEIFPLPANCLLIKGDEGKSAQIINKFQEKGISSSACEYVLKTENQNYEPVTGGFITTNVLETYLNAERKACSIFFDLSQVVNEPKVGIARDSITRIASDSMLYRVDMKRLDKVELIVDFEGIELAEKGLLKLGGEGKAISYKVIAEKPIIKLPKIEKEFVMYLATPAIFKNGWLPGFIEPDSLNGEIVKGLKVKLKSAIVNRPLLIGGFDMQKKRAKPMRKAVPAGSLYFFEIEAGSSALLEDSQGKAMSDFMAEEGFGLTYFGITNKEIDN